MEARGSGCGSFLVPAHPVHDRRVHRPGQSSCPIPEIARLGRTLKKWRREFLAYLDTAGASNGGTEAVNGPIELYCRIARDFRNRHKYRLRMLLIRGGLTRPHLK